jgi:hypothetical protein
MRRKARAKRWRAERPALIAMAGRLGADRNRLEEGKEEISREGSWRLSGRGREGGRVASGGGQYTRHWH